MSYELRGLICGETRNASLMGIAKQLPGRDAYIITAESIDFIIQIHIIREVRRGGDIARVEKEFRNGLTWCKPVFRFDATSPVDAPRWERVSAAEAGQEQGHKIFA